MTDFFKGETRAENRRHPRVQMKLWIHYRELTKGELSHPGESLAEDLGTQGMAMRSDHPMRAGQLLRITLFLPPEEKRRGVQDMEVYTEEECLPVDILSRVVWCQETDQHEYILGVQFLDPEPRHRNRLKEFLIDYNLDKPDSALYI